MKLHCDICKRYAKMVRYDYRICSSCKEKSNNAIRKLKLSKGKRP